MFANIDLKKKYGRKVGRQKPFKIFFNFYLGYEEQKSDFNIACLKMVMETLG